MLHNEHLRKADELYEIRHDNNGNACHILIKDGEAIIYPTLNDLVLHQYFGEQTERFYCSEDDLVILYTFSNYSYYNLKNNFEKELN